MEQKTVISCTSHMADFRRSDSVEQKLKRLFSQWSEVTEQTLPPFANAMSLPMVVEDGLPKLPSNRLKAQFHDALVEAMAALAKQHPVLLLFEDLHWVDPSTEEIIELLIDRPDKSPF